jgi:hypothetical protein
MMVTLTTTRHALSRRVAGAFAGECLRDQRVERPDDSHWNRDYVESLDESPTGDVRYSLPA